jgi:superkiller protein 3
MKNKLFLAIFIALLLTTTRLNNRAYSQEDDGNVPDYGKYYEKGIELYNKSQYTSAIEQFTQALKLAPDNSAIRNNLAVSFISRGVYFHNNKTSNYEEAATNYREAIYYLKYDEPEGAKTSPNASGNLDIALKNLSAVILNMGENPKNPTYHFKKAKELRAKGSFKGAIVEFYSGLEYSPASAESYEAIGDIYKVLQNEERSVKAYSKAITLNSSNLQLLVKAGVTFEKANYVDNAVKAYNQATAIDPKNQDALNALQRIWENQIKINPRNAAAHANLGTVLQKKGDFPGAMAQYNAAELIDPNNILVRLNLGTLYQAKGDTQTAIRAYDTILHVDPRNVLAHYYKALALKQNKDFTNATKELNTVLQIDPKNDLAKKELVALSQEAGINIPQATNIIKDLANQDTNNAKAQYDVAYEAHSKGNLDEAITFYKKAIALDPQMKDAYTNLGAALLAKKQYSEALNSLNKANQIDPTDPEISKLLKQAREGQNSSKYQAALALHQQGKINEAIAGYEEALKEDPNNAELLVNLGAAYQTNKNYDLAISYYNKSVAISPDSPVTYYYIGSAYHSKNNLEEAIKYYRKSVQLDPNNQQVKDTLKLAENDQVQIFLSQAIDLYNQKQYEQARLTIDKALKNDPDNASAYYYLGLIMDAKSNFNIAITSYRKATQLDPTMDSAYYSLAIDLDKVNDKPGAKMAFNKYLQIAGSRNDAFVKYAKERVKQL